MKIDITAASLNIGLAVDAEDWTVNTVVRTPEDKIILLDVSFSHSTPAPVPHFKFSWTFPAIDIAGRWSPNTFRNRQIPPNWSGQANAELGTSAPVITLFSQNGQNRQTFAFSDAMNATRMRCGVEESNSLMECWLDAFWIPRAPVNSYTCTLRIDTQDKRYEDALQAVARWWAAMPDYTPCPVPQDARKPVYSSWYGFHQNLFADQIEAECKLATEFNMASIIIDDGWQTADNHRGYAFCGDWEMCTSRFPDIVQHVKNVHALGLKYILWYSMPWVGVKSKNYQRFEGKYLYLNNGLGAAALDPRFPEVREFLISTYEKAMTEWDLDGFKLDFIDSFNFGPTGKDIAIEQNYEGRDCKALTEGIDKLLVGTMERLRAIKPDVMIEFRQSYIGPAMRKYGNMFRAADCPNDYITNRIRTIDVRLLADTTAVHSDMLMWHYDEPVVAAARQCWNILFSVPQLSLRIKDIPAAHRAMMKFYISFWLENKDLLLDGTLRAEHPEICYPVVTSTLGSRSLTALYATGHVVTCDQQAGQEKIIVNASGADGIVVDLARRPRSIAVFDTTGQTIDAALPEPGLGKINVPDSGLVKLFF